MLCICTCMFLFILINSAKSILLFFVGYSVMIWNLKLEKNICCMLKDLNDKLSGKTHIPFLSKFKTTYHRSSLNLVPTPYLVDSNL